MCANIIKRQRRGNLSFILIILIVLPVMLLSMVKLIGNSYDIQNSLLNISRESSITNSIFEVTLFESLNYIDGIALSDFNSTELKNKVDNTLSTSFADLDIEVLVNEDFENGKLQLNLDVNDKKTLALKINNIELENMNTSDGVENVENVEGEGYIAESDYILNVLNYVESRYLK